MTTNEELIADARAAMDRRDDTGWLWACRLADALEAATRERAVVPDAATEQARADSEWRDGTIIARLAKAEAERDTALAAVERVRAEADAYAEQPDVMELCGAVAQALRTALTDRTRGGFDL